MAWASAGPWLMSRRTARPTAMPHALPRPWAMRPAYTAAMVCARHGEDRAGDIERQARNDHGPPPEAVGHRPEQHLPCPLRDQEDRHDGLHPLDRRAEIGLHRPERRQCDVAGE